MGCEEYFNDPLIDKQTGEDVNPLIVDFNFFSTSMTYKLLDEKDGNLIQREAKIYFTGSGSTNIVTFSGEKKDEFYTTEGLLELTVDPNIYISEDKPLEFAVHVDVEGYNSIAKGLQIFNEGRKTFALYLSKTKDGGETNLVGNANLRYGDTTLSFVPPTPRLKSAKINEEKPFSIKYSLSVNDLLKFKDAEGNYIFDSKEKLIKAYEKDKDNFVHLATSKFNDHKPGIELYSVDCIPNNVLFKKLESGKLINLIVHNKVVADLNGGVIRSSCDHTEDDEAGVQFGFVNFENCSWNLIGNEITHDNLNFNFTLGKVIDDSLCKTGGKIKFNSNVKSCFSFEANILDNEGNFISAINFRGDFSESFVLENIPQTASKIVFKNNNPAFAEISDIVEEDLCNGNIKINVNPIESFKEFQIVLKVLCPDNPAVAISPSFNAEIKQKDNDGYWQGITMKGGKSNVLVIPNQDYELRFLWEGEWKYTAFSTKVDNEGNYNGNSRAGSKIHSQKMEDGRIRINIEKIFDENFCNDLGW